MIDGCGPTFNAHIDQELLDLIFTALTHTNRFVRETGYYVCSSLVGCNYAEGKNQTNKQICYWFITLLIALQICFSCLKI